PKPPCPVSRPSGTTVADAASFEGGMRNFLRSLRYSWPYRYRLGASVICAACAALLWGLNLSAVLPVLKLLTRPEQSWAAQLDEAVDVYQRDYDRTSTLLDNHRVELQRVAKWPEGAERDRRERQLTGAVVQLEAQLARLSRNAYWGQTA